MWILLWIVLSVVIAGVFVWSFQILYRQKKAWKAFAAKLNLKYESGPTFMASPVISGNIGSYAFGLFSEQRPTEDARGQRFNTVIEIALRQGLPVPGVVGTEAMASVITTLEAMTEDLKPADPDWDPKWIIRTSDAAALDAYLTPARLEVLKKIFRRKIMAALFVFDDSDAVLRIETVDPLQDAEKIEKIVKGLIQQLEILGPAGAASPPLAEAPAAKAGQ